LNGLLLQDTVVEYVQTRNVIPAHYHCRLCSMCAPEAQCSRRNRLQRASFFLPLVRGSNRILPRPNKKNDGRLSPQKRLAAPGLDRVQQGNATSGLRISLEQQYGDLLLASAQVVETAFDRVALKFLKVEALRAEYQNPLMGNQLKCTRVAR